MKPISKIDGSPINVVTLPDSRVFVDAEPGEGHRGGPDHPRHHCRFYIYGLSDDRLRCIKCGMLKKVE